MTTVKLNTVTRRVEVFSSARDEKARADIAELQARTITGGGLAIGGGDLSADRVITVAKASGAEADAGTDDSKAVTPLALATPLAGKQPLDTDLTAIAGLSGIGLIARTADGAAAARSLAGTADRIAVADGDGASADPRLDIAPTYAGQTSITTLGTITTGTWQGTEVAVGFGGTGTATEAAARTALGISVDSKAALEAASIAAAILTLELLGYTTVGDGGGARYKRVASEPAHAGKIRSVDRFLPDGTTDATNGGWWELVSQPARLEMFGAAGDGVTNDDAAWQAALRYLEAIGGGVLQLLSKTYLVTVDRIVPSGVSIYGLPGARLKATGTSGPFLKCGGSQILLGFELEGPGTDATFVSHALVHVVNVERVGIKGVRGIGGRGDGIRLQNAHHVWIDDTEWDVSRNVVTVNDSLVDGTRDVRIDGIAGESYNGGFLAESDDATNICQRIWLDNYHFKSKAATPASTGIAFSKSTSTGAGSFKKYREIWVGKGLVDGFFWALGVRGAENVECNGIRSKNCTRVMDIGQANDVVDCRIKNFDFEATSAVNTFGITEDLVLQDGKITTGAGTLLFHAQTRPKCINVEVTYTGANSAFGFRMTSCPGGVVRGCTVRNAGTLGYSLSGHADGPMTVEGNRAIGDTVTMATGYRLTGSERLVFRNNEVDGSVTTPLENEAPLATVDGNVGIDSFQGSVNTSDATGDDVVWNTGGTFIPISNASNAAFEIVASCVQTGSASGAGASYHFRGIIRNDDSGASPIVAFIGAPVKTVVGETFAGLDAEVTADTTNNGIKLTVTGIADTFRWQARAKLNVLTA